MSSSVVRIVPFLAASVAVHAIAIGALGTDRLSISTASPGAGQEVSIRLEAAAPAGAAADPVTKAPVPSETGVSGTPPNKSTAAERQAPRDRQERETASSKSAAEEPAQPAGRAATAPPAARATANASGDAQASRDEPRNQDTEPAPIGPLAAVDHSSPGEATENSTASRARVRQAIVTELARYFRYPRLAQRRGWQGTVVLVVQIRPDGQLDGIRVKESSGHAVLDRSAVSALAEVKRLPQFAERLGSEGLALEIPVTYRLESA